jgi:hypothetical protein
VENKVDDRKFTMPFKRAHKAVDDTNGIFFTICRENYRKAGTLVKVVLIANSA